MFHYFPSLNLYAYTIKQISIPLELPISRKATPYEMQEEKTDQYQILASKQERAYPVFSTVRGPVGPEGATAKGPGRDGKAKYGLLWS